MRTMVITGSASGMGAALRDQLEAEGDRVIGVDLSDAEVAADLSTPEGRAAAVGEVLQLAPTLDGAVVCAGLGPHVQPARLLVAVNFFGAVDVLDGLLPALAEGDQPAAVAIASNSVGLVPSEGTDVVDLMLRHDEPAALDEADRVHGGILYGLTKQALSRAIRQRAEPWGRRGVRLNAVAPGPVATPLLQGSLDDPELGPLVDALPVPLGRRAEPDEVATVIRFLLSPQAAFVHGSLWFIDGGTDAQVRPDHV